MRLVVVIAIAAAAVTGCSKDDAKAGAATTTSTAASAAPAGSGSATKAAPASAAGPATWAGKYTAAPGSFYVPDGGEWSGVKFRGDDAGTGLGDGTLKVTIDPTGRAHGALDGPLGPLHVDGELRDALFSATLTPDDPSSGFSGMLIGRADGGKIAGTLRASAPTGNVIREATFSLERSATN